MLVVVRRVAHAYRAAFSGLEREVWLLALGAFVNRAGTMVLPFLGLYLTRRLGMSAIEAGQVLAMYGVGSVLGSFLGGWLSDRLGAIRVQLLSLVTSGAAFLLITAADDFLTVALAVLLASTLADAFRPAMMVATAHFSTPTTRTRAFALIRLAVNLGMAIGPAVGGVLAVRHYGWLFIGDAVTCWAAAGLLAATLGLPAARVRREGAAPSPAIGGSAWRDLPFLTFLGLILVLAVVFFQIWSTMPLYLRNEIGLTEPAIGGLLALNAIAIVLFEMLLLKAVEHLDPLRLVALGSVLVGGGLGLLALPGGLPVALASVAVWTLGEMLTLPLSNAAVAHRAPPDRVGSYMGAYMVSYSLAFVIAPLAGTAIYGRWGGIALWPSLAAIGTVLGLGFAALSRRFRQATT